MMMRCISLMEFFAVCLCMTAIVCSAASQPTLDELLDITTDAPPPSDVTDDALDDDPKSDSAQDVAGLFKQVVALMDNASDRLGLRRDPGLTTQRIQQSALAKLDQIIAQAKRQKGGGNGKPQPQNSDRGSAKNAQPTSSPPAATGNQPNQGAPTRGQVGRVEPSKTPLKQLRSQWGHLPARLRAELLQGLNEPFSPVYQSLTESYFRRLAQERR